MSWAGVGAAQPPEPGAALRVAVLRGTEGASPKLVQAVDGALLRDLARFAGIEQPTVSPIDHAEIQLTVGCTDEGRECFTAIARTIEVDAIVLRKLTVGERARVVLIYFDANAVDQPARVERELAAEHAEDLVGLMPGLVRELFGIPEPVEASAPPPPAEQPAEPSPATGPAPVAPQPVAPPRDDGARPSVLTWVTLGLGAALVGAGAIVGLDAESSFDAWKDRDVADEADVARAESDLESIQGQGTASTVLLAGGAVVLGIGATLLALELSAGDAAPEVAVAPHRDGLAVRLRGAIGGL